MRRYSPIVLALLGLSLTACWGNRSKKPPIHLNPNMDWQPKFEAQEVNTMYEDSRAMRRPPEGVVAQGFDKSNTELWEGRDFDGRLVETLPPGIELDAELLARGEDRYNIFCSPCHDQTGSGNGIVTQRGGGFAVMPANLHANKFKAMPVGHLYDVITNGKGTMLPYEAQIVHPEDRWAIVAWVKALQLHGREQGRKGVEDKAAITELANLAAPVEAEGTPDDPASAGEDGEPEGEELAVACGENGAIVLAGETYEDSEKAGEALAKLVAANAELAATIDCPEDAPSKDVTAIVDMLKDAGVEKFAMATEEDGEQGGDPDGEQPEPPDAGATDGPQAAGGDVTGVERKGKRIKLSDGTIEFDRSDALTPESQPLVDKIAAYMNANPDILVLRVEGHTDNNGDVDKLRRKSRRWAQAVIDRMIEKGVDEGRLKNQARGDTKPLRKDDPANSKNNRIEFRILKLEEKESDNG